MGATQADEPPPRKRQNTSSSSTPTSITVNFGDEVEAQFGERFQKLEEYMDKRLKTTEKELTKQIASENQNKVDAAHIKAWIKMDVAPVVRNAVRETLEEELKTAMREEIRSALREMTLVVGTREQTYF